MATEVTLPVLAEQMEYGTVTRWLRREGERVAAGEAIVEIEAEKAAFELESPVDGVVASILAEEGDELRVGAVLAVIEDG